MDPKFSQPEALRQTPGTEDGVRLCFPSRIRGPSRQGPRLATASRDPPSSPFVGLATMHHAQDHGGFIGIEPGSHTGNRGRRGHRTSVAARDSIVTEMRCPQGADDTSKACTLRPRSSAARRPLRGSRQLAQTANPVRQLGVVVCGSQRKSHGMLCRTLQGRAAENNQLHGNNQAVRSRCQTLNSTFATAEQSRGPGPEIQGSVLELRKSLRDDGTPL